MSDGAPIDRKPARRRAADAYLAACLLELDAPKPGNVGRHAPGHGMSTGDFIRSAEASVGPLTDAGLTLGERIYRAVEATWKEVECNTNLGIILLSAPLLQASMIHIEGEPLRTTLRRVLSETTVEDAEWSYRAIRLAAPAGLGRSECFDVNAPASVTLSEAMREAASRDRIAQQYADGFGVVFDYALPLLAESRSRFEDANLAVAYLYLRLLACYPDTHIARKFGDGKAREVSREAKFLAEKLDNCDSDSAAYDLLRAVDRSFKRVGINPGASADLTVAILLAEQIEAGEPVMNSREIGATTQAMPPAIFHQVNKEIAISCL